MSFCVPFTESSESQYRQMPAVAVLVTEDHNQVATGQMRSLWVADWTDMYAISEYYQIDKPDTFFKQQKFKELTTNGPPIKQNVQKTS